MVGLDGATAIETRWSGPRPAGSSWVKAAIPGVQLSANHTPELTGAVVSFTATHSRVGVAPCACRPHHVGASEHAPATVLNGADGHLRPRRRGPRRCASRVLDVAATNVVGVAGSTARRKMPRPGRFVPSTLHTCANGSAAPDGPTARRIADAAGLAAGDARSTAVCSSPVPTSTSSSPAFASKRTYRPPHTQNVRRRRCGRWLPASPPSRRAVSTCRRRRPKTRRRRWRSPHRRACRRR